MSGLGSCAHPPGPLQRCTRTNGPGCSAQRTFMNQWWMSCSVSSTSGSGTSQTSRVVEAISAPQPSPTGSPSAGGGAANDPSVSSPFSHSAK